jgi:hypothetical protein
MGKYDDPVVIHSRDSQARTAQLDRTALAVTAATQRLNDRLAEDNKP